MNRSTYFFLLLLASGSIMLGLLLGYKNSQEPDVIVSRSDQVGSVEGVQKSVDNAHSVAENKVIVGDPDLELDQRNSETSRDSYAFDQYAIESMTEARLTGDHRAPPIGQRVVQDGPTVEELESPELYLEYESRQEKKIYRAYVDAADIKIEMLEDQIAKAKERGLPNEQLNVGIEKVKRIKAMKDQLLLENPDIQ